MAKDYCNFCEHRDPEVTHKYCVKCGRELIDQNAVCGHLYRYDWIYCPICGVLISKA